MFCTAQPCLTQTPAPCQACLAVLVLLLLLRDLASVVHLAPGGMATMHPPSITQVADQCFDELATHIDNQGQLTIEQISKMSLLLGRNWQKALQVVDQNEVECYIGENSKRHIFQVRGKSGVYVTFAKSYCSCQAHYYEVVCKSEAPYCKHQLAARLAYALKRCPVIVVPDSAIAEFLLNS